MKRAIAVCLLTVVMSAVAPFARAGSCPGYETSFSDPPGAVCGNVFLNTATYLAKPSKSYSVKFCLSSDGSGFCRTGATQWARDGYGTYSWSPFIAFNGYNYGTTYQTYYVFVWNDEDHWGSSTVPIRTIDMPGQGALGVTLYAPPAALPPTPVYPADDIVLYTTDFPVRWQEGLTAERASSSWPVVYDLYYKFWTTYGAEPSYWTLSGVNMPCNKDATGNCSTYVTGMASGYYRWRMVAKMDVSASVGWNVAPAVFTTESAATYFSIRSGRIPGCCR